MHPYPYGRLFKFPVTARSEARHSPLQQVSLWIKRKEMSLPWCFEGQGWLWVLYRNSGYFIYNLGLLDSQGGLWGSSSVLSGILCPSTQGLQHPTRCSSMVVSTGLCIARFVGTCVHGWHWRCLHNSKFASEWQQLQPQREKLQVNRIEGGLESTVWLTGPHLMLCRCALMGTAGWLSTGDSSLAALWKPVPDGGRAVVIS